MTPFTYPAVPHIRRHGPQGYAHYSSYRPWLRDEFRFRCVYRLLREQWGRVAGIFDLDHAESLQRAPGLDVPEHDRVVVTTCGSEATIGRPGHRVDRAVVLKCLQDAPALGVPHAEGLVDAPEAARLPSTDSATA
jgi:hypothetical protein